MSYPRPPVGQASRLSDLRLTASLSPAAVDRQDACPTRTRPRPLRLAGLVLATWIFSLVAAPAEEVHSNGSGGGAWSDPLSWRTRAVPGSNDVVTVAGDDQIVVDLADPQRIACKELNVDPRGMLSFKQGAGRIVLNVNGIVETYGAIRMDLTRSEDDSAELRLTAATLQDRTLRIARGGSIVAGGRAGLAGGRRNVLLVSGPIPTTNAPAGDTTGQFNALDGSSVDLLRAEVRDLQASFAYLDNTGASPGERCSVVGCRFIGRSTLQLVVCDTPLVADNEFTTDLAIGTAINVYVSTLAEVRGNTIRGPYDTGIILNSGGDSVVVSNTVEGCRGSAIQGHGPNLMLKQITVRKSASAYYLVNGVTGVAEDCVADDCQSGFFVHHTAGLQLISCRTVNMATNAPTLNSNNSQLTMLNCSIATNLATFVTGAGRTNETQEYLVVHVQGAVPAGSQIAVVTASPEKPLPPGAADLNVRNSPADISPEGWTPLPATLAALVVKSWSLVPENRLVPAPEYILRVLGPAPKPDATRPVLKEIRVTPTAAWHRPNPNERKATIEVTVP